MPDANPSAYARLIESRAYIAANWYVSTGYPPGEILRILQGGDYGLSTQRAAAALSLGQSMRIDPDKFRRLGLDRPIPWSWIPTDPNLDVPFRTIVDVEFLHPTDPEGRSYFQTVVIDSAQRPTRSSLQEAVDAMAAAIIRRRTDSDPIPLENQPYPRVASIRGIIMQ
jgi:hypothetical protein